MSWFIHTSSSGTVDLSLGCQDAFLSILPTTCAIVVICPVLANALRGQLARTGGKIDSTSLVRLAGLYIYRSSSLTMMIDIPHSLVRPVTVVSYPPGRLISCYPRALLHKHDDPRKRYSIRQLSGLSGRPPAERALSEAPTRLLGPRPDGPRGCQGAHTVLPRCLCLS